jgi:hypothetical protein
MKAVKGLVIGMGVLILVGFVVVAVTLVMRAQGGREAKAPFQNMVRLPAGGQIIETRLSDDRILLRVRNADGAEALIVLDADNGQEMGRLNVAIAP